jgi:hypothetical protein
MFYSGMAACNFELEKAENGSVEIAYFGLIEEFLCSEAILGGRSRSRLGSYLYP